MHVLLARGSGSDLLICLVGILPFGTATLHDLDILLAHSLKQIDSDAAESVDAPRGVPYTHKVSSKELSEVLRECSLRAATSQ